MLATLSNHIQPHYTFPLSSTNYALRPLMDDSGSVVMPAEYDHNSGVNAIPEREFEVIFASRPALTSITGLGTLLISYTNKLIEY